VASGWDVTERAAALVTVIEFSRRFIRTVRRVVPPVLDSIRTGFAELARCMMPEDSRWSNPTQVGLFKSVPAVFKSVPAVLEAVPAVLEAASAVVEEVFDEIANESDMPNYARFLARHTKFLARYGIFFIGM
jgi:hypothetical protein